MKKVITAAGVAILAIGISACGASSSSPSRSVSPGVPASTGPVASSSAAVDYKQQYLDDSGPYFTAFSAEQADLSATITSSDTVAFGQAADVFSKQLLAQSWPANAQADIHTLALAVAKINPDVKNKDASAFDEDTMVANEQDLTVRSDLGITNASGS